VLYLYENQISDIIPLGNLASLTVLELYGNQISDISPLQNLTSLTELTLSRNQISDLSPLSNLTNLTYLNLKDNQISDISPLVENSGLGEGDVVTITDNNLDLSEGSEDMENIGALEDRGVVVYYQ
jgi:internalin A